MRELFVLDHKHVVLPIENALVGRCAHAQCDRGGFFPGWKVRDHPGKRQQRKLVAGRGSPVKRRKWLAAAVLSLVSGGAIGALMVMGLPKIVQDEYQRAVARLIVMDPPKIVQDVYQRGLAQIHLLTAPEDAAIEAAAQQDVEGKAVAKEVERKAASAQAD